MKRKRERGRGNQIAGTLHRSVAPSLLSIAPSLPLFVPLSLCLFFQHDTCSRAGGDDDFCWFVVQFLHVCDKPVAASGDGDDITMVVFVAAESFSEQVDISAERAFLDNRFAPDRLHQFVLLNHPSAHFHQRQQRVKGLRRERLDFSRAQQKTFLRIQAEDVEFVEVVLRLGHSEFVRNSEKLSKPLSRLVNAAPAMVRRRLESKRAFQLNC